MISHIAHCSCSNIMSADGNYVGRIPANVTFPPGSSAGDQVCANTLIYSDGVLESSEATVNIRVSSRQFGRVSVPVERRFARVTIVDANGKQLNLVVYKDLARCSGVARTQLMPWHGHTFDSELCEAYKQLGGSGVMLPRKF